MDCFPENLSASAHTTYKQVISRRGNDKKGDEMYKNEKRTCKACKSTIFALNMQICDVFELVVVVAQAPCYFADY